MNSDIVQIDGWLRPWPGRSLDRDDVARALRAAGISGGVGPADSAGDLPLVLAVQGGLPLVVPGAEQFLVDALAEVAEATGGAIMLTDEQMLVTPPSMEESWQALLDGDDVTEPVTVNPPDVLMARLDADLLPLMAREVGSPFMWERVGDFDFILFEEPSAALHEQAFLKRELPAVALSLIGGRRYINVLLARGVLPGTILSRQEPWALTHAPETVEHPAVRAALVECADRHTTPEADIAALLDSQHLPGAAEIPLREALAAPDDEHWSARVLTALGLPSHAADVHEGRTAMTAPERIEAQGLRALFRTVMKRGQDRK